MTSGLDLGHLRVGLIFYLILVTSLCVHEWAHAFTADRLGDDTPRNQGRVTLNPLAHMDLYGTAIFPLACIFLFPGGLLFGWGRPVMINPGNFAPHRVRGELLTTLAGPGSNLVLALIAAVIGGFAFRADPRSLELFRMALMVNVALAVFNLLPVPPLDGGQVLRHLTGMSDLAFMRFSRWGFLLILLAFMIPTVRAALGHLMLAVASPFVAIFNSIVA